MKTHVTTYFLKWHENRLPVAERERIDRHLLECENCGRYFASMSRAVEPAISERLPSLAPDPFLSSRIKALADQGGSRSHFAIPILRLSAVSAMFCIAVAIGIFLGKGLAPQRQKETNNADIYSTYYTALSQQNFASVSWDSLLTPPGEKKR